MLRVAICDDEKSTIELLEDLIKKIAKRNQLKMTVESFLSGEMLENAIRAGATYDILYLDIHMHDLDGMETARHIREIDHNLLLIYVSSHDEYCMELFQFNVFCFIKKPVDEKRFEAVFMTAYERICSLQIYYSYQFAGKQRRVLMKDIMWFESVGRKVAIHLQGGTVEEFNGKLNEVEEKVSQSAVPFIRIHQSYLVNYYMTVRKNQTIITMNDGKELPISDDRRSSVKKRFNRLMGGEISV